MKTDLGNKLLGLIKESHSAFDEKRVESELTTMEDCEVCTDVLNLYNKVKDEGCKGTANSLNSLVLYLLGITSAKPTADFHLEKRRTYGRSGFPDVDLDFNHQRRHEVAEYLIDKYGRDKVANIGTVQRLTTKNCVHKTIMVLDPDHATIFGDDGEKVKDGKSEIFDLRMRIVGNIPHLMKRADGSLVRSVEEAYNEYAGFQQEMKSYPEVYRIAKEMEGGISAYGSHAAGFVISPFPLSEIAPLHVTAGDDNSDDDSAGREKTIATQYCAGEAESLGLIKFDVLGLLTKTVITMAQKLIKDRHMVDIDVDTIPLDDPETIALLKTGKVDGIFQLENPGMQRTVVSMGVDSFDSLVVAVAMYRPGPMEYIPEYTKRKKNPGSVHYIHPIVEKYTKSTYGIIVYQEQAMLIFTELAGLTTSEGYLFIKGAAKKKPELFQSMKDRFIRGATKTANQKVAEEVWRQMEPFQGYAFNKSHAVCYGYESWKTAWLKAHYPIEFMAARLSIAALDRKFDDVEKFEADCYKNLGIRILDPDLNESKMTYTITDEKTLRRPLSIKGIGRAAAEELVANQPYKGPDFVESLALKSTKVINKSVIEVMYDAGLFGKIGKKKACTAFEMVKADRRKAKGRQTGDIFG